MKNLLLILLVFISLVSCKSTSDKASDFVRMYNRSGAMIGNSYIKSTKAAYIKSGNIDIVIETKYNNGDIETEIMKNSLPDLIGQVIKSDRLGKELLDAGVVFNVKVYGTNFVLLASKSLDKTNINAGSDSLVSTIANGEKPSRSQLNQVLDIFNKNLPVVDKESGISILKMSADDNNNIIYIAEVPDDLAMLLENNQAKSMMKEELLQSPQIKQVLSKTAEFGVTNLKYIYQTKAGKVISEIEISKNDLK